MDHVIIAFRSRAQTMRFAEALRVRGVFVEVVNTPREADVGCGLSARIPKKYLPFVRRMAMSGAYDSFAGIFQPMYSRGRLIMRRI